MPTLSPRQPAAAKRAIASTLIALTFLSFVVTAIPGCGEKSPVVPKTGAGDPLIARVEELLQKDAASTEDQAFIKSLSAEDLDRILAYYQTHPKSVPASTADTVVALRGLDPLSATATTYIGEWIECRDGFGGWIASSWFHTTACGGDANDHFYFYPAVPGAYQYAGYLQGRSIHPGILLTMASFGWRLSARVYPSNNVYICVGTRMHWLGVTHEAWRTSFNLYSAR